MREGPGVKGRPELTEEEYRLYRGTGEDIEEQENLALVGGTAVGAIVFRGQPCRNGMGWPAGVVRPEKIEFQVRPYSTSAMAKWHTFFQDAANVPGQETET
jgi:hypothetical protein